eukprot:TRINITY_DN34514_c0_g1_i1.p1 TRINITY_DN34514_c0_g1~~TRINITY_DN34514_c0_g1_i1.p1  ORF type:complete len:390 (-),score=124.08 TRINITY_DN34514_c0_g1_i1:35-1204(-)
MHTEIGESVAQLVVEKCFEKFRKLPKQGKPTDTQWTVLSAIALVKTSDQKQIKILSLATGTKCLDGSTRLKSNPGTLLHDCHAEVLARRGFMLWLVEEMLQAMDGSSQYISVVGENKYDLEEGWQIFMVSTHPPCGDATIFVKDGEKFETCSDVDLNEDGPPCKKAKLDLNRTGAKLVSGSDPLSPGLGYHKVGEVRTKPGRGERTLSLSCSDKIIKWNMVGLQGALCSYFLSRDLHLHSFVLTGNMFNKPALERALYDRAGVDHVNKPILDKVDLDFEFCRSDARPSPCPDSVVWVDVGGGKVEALTEGHKQGWARKKLTNPMSWSMLCQRNIAKRVLELGGLKLVGSSKTYAELKSKSPNYSDRRDGDSILKYWPQKEISKLSLPDL